MWHFEIVRVLEGLESHLEEAVSVKQKQCGQGETNVTHRGRDETSATLTMKRVSAIVEKFETSRKCDVDSHK